MRDDFSQRTKDLLANRVGWKCSNPNCRKATRGAGTVSYTHLVPASYDPQTVQNISQHTG